MVLNMQNLYAQHCFQRSPKQIQLGSLAMFMAHTMPREPPSPEDTLIPILAHNRMLPITVKALK